MMKKILVLGMAAVLAVSAAACGKKDGSGSTSSAAAEVVESSEAVGESVITATVQKLDGDTLTVELDDGQSMSFDVSKAAMSGAWVLEAGDQVDIGYDGEDPADGMAVKSVVVSVPFEYLSEDYAENTTLYGRVESVDDKTITVRELLDDRSEDAPELAEGEEPSEEDFLGDSYTFDRAAFETVVSKDGVNPGVYAQISYLGELGQDALSFRICTEDMEEDEAADVTAIKGQVEKVEEGVIYLKGDDTHTFKFATAGNDELLQQANALSGKNAIVAFSDSLRQRVATADSIQGE